ncbi:hypothetical protein [Phaeovulum vinaykumarii]|uniref:Uncharacterized protein n=1 Tax=Phaeovulum vinaykumarii TaxID=407234 RepID=A0A1N7KWF4_9RHOB|nr:hypothetical protein [Phaeovulum vinaykumarii]SIS65933.1 hypothetical protein SAMN05421795_102243 [Phaeovulum vinaykumarii]SOC01158.1 hypothetical protein SAMN05878426_102529 [Phaeovulum vinaykumarii]
MSAHPDPYFEPLRSRPWNAALSRARKTCAHVPSMLHDEEQALVFWLAAEWADGRGQSVDLGTFVGGAAARMAAGHAEAGHPQGGEPDPVLVHAYDWFRAKPRIRNQWLAHAGQIEAEGDDILPLAHRLTAPWEHRLTWYRGDVGRQRWAGGPIGILVQDAGRDARVADHVAAAFLPALQPGRGVVLIRDMMDPALPWLAAQFDLLRPWFTPIAQVGRASVLLGCTAAPDPGALAAIRTAQMTDTALAAAASRAAQALSPQVPLSMHRAQMTWLLANPGTRKGWEMRPPLAETAA